MCIRDRHTRVSRLPGVGQRSRHCRWSPCHAVPHPTTTTTTVASSQPDNPGDTKNCGDFANYSEAKAWFDTYYEYYGDVANLDGDNDGEPCESLPEGP